MLFERQNTHFKSVLFFLLFPLACTICSCGTEINKREGKIARLLDPENLDSSISPAEDFFLFANGNWLKNNPIPASETRWGSLNILEENNYQVLHELLEKAALNTEREVGSPDQKVGDFYRSGMDTVAIEIAGLTPIKQYLQRIDLLTEEAILAEIVKLHTEGFNPVFSVNISPDDKDVSRQICKFYQGGLAMSEPEFYYQEDAHSALMRKEYRQYLYQIFSLLGCNQSLASRYSHGVIELERSLALASMSRSQKQAVYNLYHKYHRADWTRQTPNIDWAQLLIGLGIRNEDSLIVGQPNFFIEFSKQLKMTSVELWKAYLKFHLVNAMAPFLNKDLASAHFNFYNKAIRGQPLQQERWKFVLNVIDGSIGELLGQMYVNKTFKPEAKKRMTDLVDNIQKTYRERILRLDWMTRETKQKAVEKLDAITKKIGYPERFKDYSAIDIDAHNFVKNIISAATFRYHDMIGKLGKPVNKAEWNLTSPTVNACYNLAFNEIVFPAGILQYSSNAKTTEDIACYEIVFHRNEKDPKPYRIILPSGTLHYPYFIENADDAVNYGSIGTFIAHEMTHGFDYRGRHYDVQGNLNNWWTAEDEKRFAEKAKKLVSQFNQYTVLDTLHVNGTLTLGENIADLGGLQIAYEAFKKTKQGKSKEKIEGFTPDQRFFLSWAQLWRAATRDEETRIRIRSDHHAPYQWRCNGVLSNMPEFYRAFNVHKGDKMYLPDQLRAKVW
jgi:putative endopeptidase